MVLACGCVDMFKVKDAATQGSLLIEAESFAERGGWVVDHRAWIRWAHLS